MEKQPNDGLTRCVASFFLFLFLFSTYPASHMCPVHAAYLKQRTAYLKRCTAHLKRYAAHLDYRYVLFYAQVCLY